MAAFFTLYFAKMMPNGMKTQPVRILPSSNIKETHFFKLINAWSEKSHSEKTCKKINNTKNKAMQIGSFEKNFFFIENRMNNKAYTEDNIYHKIHELYCCPIKTRSLIYTTIFIKNDFAVEIFTR